MCSIFSSIGLVQLETSKPNARRVLISACILGLVILEQPCLEASHHAVRMPRLDNKIMKGQKKEGKEVVEVLPWAWTPAAPGGYPFLTPITHEILISKGFLSRLRRGWWKRKFQLSFPEKNESWGPLLLKEMGAITAPILDTTSPSPIVSLSSSVVILLMGKLSFSVKVE